MVELREYLKRFKKFLNRFLTFNKGILLLLLFLNLVKIIVNKILRNNKGEKDFG